MRVIAGTARSMPLEAPGGNGTRPTTDRIKETLFNTIQGYIPDCVFVDMYAGSGAVGIEALSRGAARAYFIDNNRQALDCIRKNLSFTGLSDRATIIGRSAIDSVYEIREQADVVFLDPPYKVLPKKALRYIRKNDIRPISMFFTGLWRGESEKSNLSGQF